MGLDFLGGLQQVSDWCVGFGDTITTIPFTGTSLSKIIRDAIDPNVESYVHTCSSEYQWGEIGGLFATLGLGAVAGEAIGGVVAKSVSTISDSLSSIFSKVSYGEDLASPGEDINGTLKSAAPVGPAKGRVYIRVSTRQAILNNAERLPNGDFVDPNTGEPIPKDGPYDIGHKPDYEWWKTQAKARVEGWTRRQVIEYENNPAHYQIEDPSSNRSHLYEAP